MLEKPTIVEKWQKKNRFGRPGTALNYTKLMANIYTHQLILL